MEDLINPTKEEIANLVIEKTIPIMLKAIDENKSVIAVIETENGKKEAHIFGGIQDIGNAIGSMIQAFCDRADFEEIKELADKIDIHLAHEINKK
jgi:hypothetical protein